MRLMRARDMHQFGPSRHERLLQQYQQLLRDHSYSTEEQINDAQFHNCTELQGLIHNFDYAQCLKF